MTLASGMRPQFFVFLLMAAASAHAELLVEGADGSDGSLVLAADTVVDLALAQTAQWDTPGDGNGVYDAEQWAVVYKYDSVNIQEGVTVTFANHPSRAPVVWLVSGDVTIDGTLSVSGADSAMPPGLAEPGPGGFRGGMGYYTPGVDASPGFGPGGANFKTNEGYGGSYGTQGNEGPIAYGNPSLIPLVGGSGGGGDGDSTAGGGAGGGALLIACEGTLTINGSVLANGGTGKVGYYVSGGGGSGGGIRLVANTVAGVGEIIANGGIGQNYHGGVGRIRIEYVTDTSSLAVTPSPSVVPLTSGDAALLWPPSSAPQVAIVSIGGASVDADPRASFGTYGADAAIPETTSTQVVLETTNVEAASQVQVRVTPRMNTAYSVIDATLDSTLSTDPLVLRWVADIPVDIGYSAVQAKVIRP